MRQKKRVVFVSLILVGLLILGAAGFWLMGGGSLVRLYANYLSEDVPEKKYGWSDFVEREDAQQVSGYYAGAYENNLFVWTLSGLKHYAHKEGTSVYYYLDVCGVIRDKAESLGEEQRYEITPEISFTLSEWAGIAKAGDYVLVRWMRDEHGRKVADKIQGSSNQHYPITELGVEQCQN